MKIKLLAAAALLVASAAHADKNTCIYEGGDILANSMIKAGNEIMKQTGAKSETVRSRFYSSAEGFRVNPPRWLDQWYDHGVIFGGKYGPKDKADIARRFTASTEDFFKKKSKERGEDFDTTAQGMAKAAAHVLTCGYYDGAGMKP